MACIVEASGYESVNGKTNNAPSVDSDEHVQLQRQINLFSPHKETKSFIAFK